MSDWENLILWERDIYVGYLYDLNKTNTSTNLSKEELSLIKSTGKKNQAIIDVVSTKKMSSL